jgi:hypothetical protein
VTRISGNTNRIIDEHEIIRISSTHENKEKILLSTLKNMNIIGMAEWIAKVCRMDRKGAEIVFKMVGKLRGYVPKLT